MKIASSLLNWLTKPAPQAETVNTASAEKKPAEKPAQVGSVAQDSVRFSPLAQKLSQAHGADSHAQITHEERLALQQQFQPQTYKPTLMQVAQKFLGLKV